MAHSGPIADAGQSLVTSQLGMRLFNERLALSLIRKHGALSKAAFARLSGLSMQAAAVILRQLEADGLLMPGEKVRLGVGQPATPLTLDPEGAFAIGCKLGRRSTDLVLVDLAGTTRHIIRNSYSHPTPDRLEALLDSGLAEIAQKLSPAQQDRICGLGVAAPHEMWSWPLEAGLPGEAAALWRSYDLPDALRRRSPWPVQIANDANAGCAAELIFGNRTGYRDFLYIFIGTLVGGGVVLHGSLHGGARGYAGALGSVVVGGTATAPTRLIEIASLACLETRLQAAGHDAAALLAGDAWTGFDDILARWTQGAAEALAIAIGSAVSVIDFEAVIIDGGIPPALRDEIVARTRDNFARLDMQGTAPVEIVAGSVGRDARVLGAASLPLLSTFTQDRKVLFERIRG